MRINNIEVSLVDPITNFPIDKEAKFLVPQSYQRIYIKLFGAKGLDVTCGLKAKDTIPILQKACRDLDNRKVDNYWQTEEAQARLALHTLISLAKLHPEAVWK